MKLDSRLDSRHESNGAFIAHFEFLLTVYRTFRVSSFYGDRLVEMREEIASTSKKFEMKRRNVKCSELQ